MAAVCYHSRFLVPAVVLRMQRLIALLLVSPALACASPSSPGFADALEGAAADSAVPVRIEVDCAGPEGPRSMRVYPGGAAIFSNAVQVSVDDALRATLVRELQDSGFATFKPRYGGEDKPEKAEAPLKVTCRVAARVAGVEHVSVQAERGEQFEPLTALAERLLGHVSPLSPAGTRADSLADGLAKVADGRLAPEVLTLRWVRLPGREAAGTGTIVHVEGGRFQKRAYRPGAPGEDAAWQPLDATAARRIAAAAAEAGYAAFPVNLPGEVHDEMELGVMGQRASVIARPFTRIAPGELADEARRLQHLITVVDQSTGG